MDILFRKKKTVGSLRRPSLVEKQENHAPNQGSLIVRVVLANALQMGHAENPPVKTTTTTTTQFITAFPFRSEVRLLTHPGPHQSLHVTLLRNRRKLSRQRFLVDVLQEK
jgi:hypothetical protein